MASARETDLNPNMYVGLSFPLRRDNNNDFAMTKNSLQQARHNLKNLLLTHVGERVSQPDQNKIFVEVKFSTTLNPQSREAITVDAGYTAERV